MTVEVGGPAMFESFGPEGGMRSTWNGRVLVLEIDPYYFGYGLAGIKVKGDEPSNVHEMFWCYPHELRALGG
jgi:hypothetical protein